MNRFLHYIQPYLRRLLTEYADTRTPFQILDPGTSICLYLKEKMKNKDLFVLKRIVFNILLAKLIVSLEFFFGKNSTTI